MKRLIRFTIGIATFTAVLFCTAFSACAKSSDAAGLRQTAAGIYRWADEEKLIQSAGSSPADWYLIAAARLGMLQHTTAAKDAALSAVKSAYQDGGYRKTTDCERAALVYAALGGNITNPTGDGSVNLAADGVYRNEKLSASGINAQIFGLLALDAAGATVPAAAVVQRDAMIQMILKQQLSASGGFTLAGSNPDPDVTAMTVTSLAPYYQKNAQVAAAIERALEFLSKAQQEDGGYQSYGTPNCESAAQVIIALCALGIDPAQDSRFIKQGNTPISAMLTFQQTDGGFAHLRDGKSDGNASAQAMCALAAYVRFLEKKSPLYAYASDSPAVYRQIDTAQSGGSVSSSGDTAHNSGISNATAAISDRVSGSGTDGSALVGTTGSNTDDMNSATDIPMASDSSFAEEQPNASGNMTAQSGGLSTLKKALIICFLLLAVSITAVVWYLVKRKKIRLTGKLCSMLLSIAALLLVSAILLGTLRVESVEEHYGSGLSAVSPSDETVRFSISCSVLLEHPESVPENLKQYIPQDGWILAETELALEPGDSVFDLLTRAVKANRIPMEYSGGERAYVQGIGYLYEFSCGELSGWMYTVNGYTAQVSCSEYQPKNGDLVCWQYTLQLGEDLS